MRFPVKVGLISAAVWIAAKMLGLALNWNLDDIRFFVILNMLLLTSAVAIGMYVAKRQTFGLNLMQDVKNGMTAGVPYALIVSVFMYFYYEKIYPEFNEKKIAEIVEKLEKPENIIALRKENIDMRNKSDREIKKVVLNNTESIYNAKFTMLVSVLALLIYSTMNSLLVAIIYRRVVFREI